jgi:hypothetical protein
MNIEVAYEIYAGGPGSGCKGGNCGRPKVNWVDRVDEKFEGKATGSYRTISIGRLVKIQREEDLDKKALAGWIKKMKQGKPIPALVMDKEYEMTDGHHRLAALEKLGVKKARVVVGRLRQWNARDGVWE